MWTNVFALDVFPLASRDSISLSLLWPQSTTQGLRAWSVLLAKPFKKNLALFSLFHLSCFFFILRATIGSCSEPDQERLSLTVLRTLPISLERENIHQVVHSKAFFWDSGRCTLRDTPILDADSHIGRKPLNVCSKANQPHAHIYSLSFRFFPPLYRTGFPGGSDGKASVFNAGDPGSIPGVGRSPGEGNGSPLQYSCLENPMDGGAW